jgi:hypothetical protein
MIGASKMPKIKPANLSRAACNPYAAIVPNKVATIIVKMAALNEVSVACIQAVELK